ncbi:hypothetical protein HPB47_021496 [Ixodes persulcatus]|uniref:Uncharacterized protein n=1 Tax=Ixodes persulcatus TaxID=34615 RepID=A0AC60QCE4_IXOPE|nr:hypothetical protein HPB47_021496 [Ixodes persulcatus]
MLNYAKRNYGHPDICYDVLDAASSDVSAFLNKYGKFDRIYSFYCLHWIRDQKAVFRNIGTLLKDDGECLLVFCAQFVLYEVWLEMTKAEEPWKDIIGAREPPRSVAAAAESRRQRTLSIVRRRRRRFNAFLHAAIAAAAQVRLLRGAAAVI